MSTPPPPPLLPFPLFLTTQRRMLTPPSLPPGIALLLSVPFPLPLPVAVSTRARGAAAAANSAEDGEEEAIDTNASIRGYRVDMEEDDGREGLKTPATMAEEAEAAGVDVRSFVAMDGGRIGDAGGEEGSVKVGKGGFAVVAFFF